MHHAATQSAFVPLSIFSSETVEWWLRYHFTVQENTQCRNLARTNGIVEDF